MTDNPNAKLYMQFGLTVLVIAFLGAAWWAGKVPVEVALPVITGLIGVWIPGPFSSNIPKGMSVVPSEYVQTNSQEIAKAMSMPGRHYTRNVEHPVKELQDARNPE